MQSFQSLTVWHAKKLVRRGGIEPPAFSLGRQSKSMSVSPLFGLEFRGGIQQPQRASIHALFLSYEKSGYKPRYKGKNNESGRWLDPTAEYLSTGPIPICSAQILEEHQVSIEESLCHFFVCWGV